MLGRSLFFSFWYNSSHFSFMFWSLVNRNRNSYPSKHCPEHDCTLCSYLCCSANSTEQQEKAVSILHRFVSWSLHPAGPHRERVSPAEQLYVPGEVHTSWLRVFLWKLHRAERWWPQMPPSRAGIFKGKSVNGTDTYVLYKWSGTAGWSPGTETFPPFSEGSSRISPERQYDRGGIHKPTREPKIPTSAYAGPQAVHLEQQSFSHQGPLMSQ